MRFFPSFNTFIEIGPLSIQWYAVCILTGAAIAYFLGQYHFKKLDYSKEILSDYVFGLLFVGIIGARIWYVIFMWNELYNIEFLRKYKICCVHPIVEDDLFLFQTLFCSSSCCLISDITYFYYVNPLSITNTLMKENISLSVAKIYSDILAYKYKTTIQCATRESVVYILLFVFTESIFRASAIVQSSSIKLQEKKEILRIMLYPPALSMNWKFWYKLESKFKLKLLLYNFFVISCFNLKFMFIRQIPRISYFLKQ